MEAILDRLKQLSDSELRENMKKYGEKLGPITTSTRQLFQKRLARKIFSIEHPGESESPESESKTTTVESDKQSVGQVAPLPSLSTNKNDEIARSSPAGSGLPLMFYAVCLPNDELYNGELVFTDKIAALNLVKKYKESRFKVFKDRKEAEQFTKPVEVKPKSPVPVVEGDSAVDKTSTGVAVEKSVYKAPKPAELTTLRRSIERNDKNTFNSLVWENPRFLISSVDTPVILHEGLRYNALHLAAISNKPEMCKLVLDTVSDPQFTEKLYCLSQESKETKDRRIDFIFDLYLNMPDKGYGESPLHFACKFGFAGVVKVLLEYPRIDRNLKNKNDETPAKVVCTRCKNTTPEIKNEIEELLQGLCYVPLLRSEDNTTAPLIGQPWSPDNVLEFREHHGKSPVDPSLAIRAFAGPMSPSKAQRFRHQWTTSPSPSPKKSLAQSNIRKEDGEKGLERVGRKLAKEMSVRWSEYWEFLDKFVDFSTKQGIGVLEDYLIKQQATRVYNQWVKAHSALINNVCLDSTIATEYSAHDSYTDQDSNVSVDSESSPSRNDLFRHNKIDRGIVKDFDNSDNEISEVFLLDKKERIQDSSLVVDSVDLLSTEPEKSESKETQKVASSGCVLAPPRLKHGIDVPSSESQPPSSGQRAALESDKMNVDGENLLGNLTDEIKLATPLREPCVYDFKYSVQNSSNPVQIKNSPNHTKTPTTAPSSEESKRLPENDVKENPWREARITSGNSEDSIMEDEDSSSPEKDPRHSSDQVEKPTDLNLNDSILDGLEKLQLGSSDEDSFESAVSEVFATPNKMEVSFNSQLANLCDEMKQKLTFTPRNRLSQTVNVVSSLAENQETLFLQTKLSNFDFTLKKTLSNFKPSSGNPVPVLLIVKNSPQLSESFSDCDVLTDCVVFELDPEGDQISVAGILKDLVISLGSVDQRTMLLSVKSMMIMSLCIYKDDVPSCVELSVPALLTKLDPKDSFYLFGQRASKLDQDVFRAVITEDKDMSCFPLTEKWRKNIATLQIENQQNWPTPARIRRESRMSAEFLTMSPLALGNMTPARYTSPGGQRSSLSPSVFQFTPRTSRLTSSPKPPRFDLESHLELDDSDGSPGH